MREIKFRAWDKNSGIMLEWFTLMQSAFNLVHDKPLLWWSFQNPDVVLMQYTGLKDRNGKEIYEGDRVHYKELIPSLNERQREIQGADYVYLEFSGVVVWDDEGCSFDIDGGDHGYRGFGARGEVEIEVIGNINESKEE